MGDCVRTHSIFPKGMWLLISENGNPPIVPAAAWGAVLAILLAAILLAGRKRKGDKE